MVKLTKILDTSCLPDGVDIVGPVACMDCGYEGDIPQKWFAIDPPIKSKKALNEAIEILNKQEGYQTFDNVFWNNGKLGSVSWCPKCGSESTVDDY